MADEANEERYEGCSVFSDFLVAHLGVVILTAYSVDWVPGLRIRRGIEDYRDADEPFDEANRIDDIDEPDEPELIDEEAPAAGEKV